MFTPTFNWVLTHNVGKADFGETFPVNVRKKRPLWLNTPLLRNFTYNRRLVRQREDPYQMPALGLLLPYLFPYSYIFLNRTQM
jgi:hypothetical protein